MFAFQQAFFPIIQNDTLHCRPVVDIIEQIDLVKFNSGSRGRAPLGSGGKAPRRWTFFHCQKVIDASKLGEAATISGKFNSGWGDRPIYRGGRKGGRVHPLAPPLDPLRVSCSGVLVKFSFDGTPIPSPSVQLRSFRFRGPAKDCQWAPWSKKISEMETTA